MFDHFIYLHSFDDRFHDVALTIKIKHSPLLGDDLRRAKVVRKGDDSAGLGKYLL